VDIFWEAKPCRWAALGEEKRLFAKIGGISRER
jgi:hypothetical protein